MFSAFSGEGLPLITVWLQVRVLPGPPRIAVSEAHAASQEPLPKQPFVRLRVASAMDIVEVKDASWAGMNGAFSQLAPNYRGSLI
jgi:hypothetical protein